MPRELYGVQSLRGVAALMVVLDHATNIRAISLLPKWLSVGEAGVDLFFVISGFIMMYVTPRPFRGWPDQAAFLVRRMGRIYPAYWALALPLLLLWTINPGHVYAHPERHDLIASLFLTPSPVVPIISVAWTLVFELYFYWVASLIFYAGGALRLMLIAIWFTAIALANLLHPQPWENAWLKVGFCPITFEFIAGMFLARLLQSSSHSIHVPSWAAAAGIGAAALIGFAAGWRHGLFNIFAPDLVRVFSYGIPAVIVLGLVLKMELQQTWRGVGKIRMARGSFVLDLPPAPSSHGHRHHRSLALDPFLRADRKPSHFSRAGSLGDCSHRALLPLGGSSFARGFATVGAKLPIGSLKDGFFHAGMARKTLRTSQRSSV